jgi:copper chaperone
MLASFRLKTPKPLQENPTMIAFEVNDMTCGHCVKAITDAVKAADSLADVRIDLARHRVEIEAGAADAAALAGVIREAGYTPVPA